jgi:hypothetical protein
MSDDKKNPNDMSQQDPGEDAPDTTSGGAPEKPE